MAARIQGKHVTLWVHSQTLLLPINLGELDEFSAKSGTTLIKTRPKGFIHQGVTHNYAGYDLSFTAAKVDWKLARFHIDHDKTIKRGETPPEFFISETIDLYDGAKEQYIYKNVSFFGFEVNTAEDYVQKMEAFSPFKEIGPVDTVLFANPVDAAIMQAMFEIKNDNLFGVAGKVAGFLGSKIQ